MSIGTLALSNENFTSSENKIESKNNIQTKSRLKRQISKFATKALAVLSLGITTNAINGPKAPDQDLNNNITTSQNIGNKTASEIYFAELNKRYKKPVNENNEFGDLAYNTNTPTYTIKVNNSQDYLGNVKGKEINLNYSKIKRNSDLMNIDSNVHFEFTKFNELGSLYFTDYSNKIPGFSKVSNNRQISELAGELNSFKYLVDNLQFNEYDSLIMFFNSISAYGDHKQYGLLSKIVKDEFEKNFGFEYNRQTLAKLANFINKNKDTNSELIKEKVNFLKNSLITFVSGFESNFYSIIEDKVGNKDAARLMQQANIIAPDYNDEGIMTTINYGHSKDTYSKNIS